MDIQTGFSKLFYSGADYDLPYMAEHWILGGDSYNHGRTADKELYCGFVLPPFQRGEVWDDERKIRLMESLFCGINIGTFMAVSNYAHPEVDGWLLDGKQRLSAIRDFVLGRVAIFNGRLRYDNMDEVTLHFNPVCPDDAFNAPKKASIAWRGLSVRINRLERVHDVSILKEIYNRHNFGGIAHTDSQRA